MLSFRTNERITHLVFSIKSDKYFETVSEKAKHPFLTTEKRSKAEMSKTVQETESSYHRYRNENGHVPKIQYKRCSLVAVLHALNIIIAVKSCTTGIYSRKYSVNYS